MERNRLAMFSFRDANHYTCDDNELSHLTHFNTNHSKPKEENTENPYKVEPPQRPESAHKMSRCIMHFLPYKQ